MSGQGRGLGEGKKRNLQVKCGQKTSRARASRGKDRSTTEPKWATQGNNEGREPAQEALLEQQRHYGEGMSRLARAGIREGLGRGHYD